MRFAMPRCRRRNSALSFLVEDLFTPDSIDLVYVDLDRTVIGSAVPRSGTLELPCPDQLRATCFTERRELGILNIGASGIVRVDGAEYAARQARCPLHRTRAALDLLFKRFRRERRQSSILLSYPGSCHASGGDGEVGHARTADHRRPSTANHRSIYRLIHVDGIASCQLVHGIYHAS